MKTLPSLIAVALISSNTFAATLDLQTTDYLPATNLQSSAALALPTGLQTNATVSYVDITGGSATQLQSVTINQDSNYSAYTNTTIEGDSNQVDIQQLGASSAYANTDINGFDNTLDLQQGDGSFAGGSYSAFIEQNASRGSIDLQQTGSGIAYAAIEQELSANNSSVEIEQQTGLGEAYIQVVQGGTGNHTAVLQQLDGRLNEILLSQFGANQTASILQLAGSNYAQVLQDGANNEAYITQGGGNDSRNAAYVTQLGSGNIVTITQR